MATSTQLKDKLAECERQITAIRSRAEGNVEILDQRLALVNKKRDELVEMHKQSLKEGNEEYEHQLSSIVDKADEEIKKQQEAAAEAQNRADIADEKAQTAEQRARELGKQLRRLHASLDDMLEEHDRRYAEVAASADTRIQAKQDEANEVIRNTGLHASQVREDALDSLTALHATTRLKVGNAQSEAQQRSRYRDLLNTATNRGDISEKEFQDAKLGVLQSWYDDWTMTHSKNAEHLPKVTLQPLPIEGPVPQSARGRERAVDKNRQRAVELQMLRSKGVAMRTLST